MILDLLTCVCIAGIVCLFVFVVGAVVILSAAEVVKRRRGKHEKNR